MLTTYSEECSALVFYGIEPAVSSLAGFYNGINDWSQEVCCPFDKMSVHGTGYSRKWVSFEHGDAKLQKEGFNAITSVFVVSLTPDARIPVNDYLVTAGFSAKNSYADLVCRSSITPLSRAAMLPIAGTIIRSVKPTYGIGYKRLHSLGPAMYAIGIGQGLGPKGYGISSQLTPEERAESERISRWGNGMLGRVWEKGLLRDVYPWNFLTRPHLVKQVGTISLEKWIRQDERRGRLEPLGDGISFWEVDDINMSSIRKELLEADVIFDWKKHL